jgi:Holliday junction resolvase RusA-like endonuclease
MDPDNLQASRKPILDALKHNGLIHDDKREWCESTITWHKSSKKEMRTEITIEAVESK